MDLQKGSIGFLVRMLQEDLVLLGYDLGTTGPNKDGVDGIFGPITEQAVKDFQQAQGIMVNGRVEDETWGKMETALNALRIPIHQAPIVKIVGSEYGFAFHFLLAIQGQEFQFLLDTGDSAGEIMLTQECADLLKLQVTGEQEVTVANGQGAEWPTSKVDLTLGTLTIHDVEVVINPTGGQNLLGLPLLIKHGIWMEFHPAVTPPTLDFFHEG